MDVDIKDVFTGGALLIVLTYVAKVLLG